MNTNMATKSQMVVEKVFQSRNVWWVRSGNSHQEVKEADAQRIQARMGETGSPVTIAYVHVGSYPENYLGEIEVLP